MKTQSTQFRIESSSDDDKTRSAPASGFHSPIRHHKRTPSKSKGVKETLNARSHYGSSDDDGGASVHRINQYIIKQEIGRGSFGSVHLAEDQYGNEFVRHRVKRELRWAKIRPTWIGVQWLTTLFSAGSQRVLEVTTTETCTVESASKAKWRTETRTDSGRTWFQCANASISFFRDGIIRC